MKRILSIFFIVLGCISVCACGAKTQADTLLSPPEESGSVSICPSISGGAFPPQTEEDDSPTSQPQENRAVYAVSNVNGLIVRSGASVSAKKLGVLDKEDAVLLLGKENGFYKTVYKEQTAYVFADYCTQMAIPCANEEIERVIAVGASLLGYPYVWGSPRYHWGNGVLNTEFAQGKFDCSALTQYAFYHGNRTLLSLTTRTQVTQGKAIARGEIARGDLLFFTNAARKNNVGVERIGHVAIYLGNNYILHTASDHAVIEPISKARWKNYECARRI
ncbi:MAG: NlpC/P60 family protein [Clostridiales bacterium]|nr:NlpC/P60 family protein [Clostridiales bacterium]